MKVLILAGGFATRLWPLTEKRAKPLLLLDGISILGHILSKVPSDLEVIVLTNKKFEKDFEKELQAYPHHKTDIFCEDGVSDGEKLGALGAISAAIDHYQIREDIMILAGDNLLPSLKFSQLVCRGDNAKIAVRDVGDLYQARSFGVVEVDPKEPTRVVAFAEKPKKPKSTLVSTGFMSLGRELLPVLQKFSKKHPDELGGVFPALLKAGYEVCAESVEGEWFDVGSFQTYLEAHKVITDGAMTEFYARQFPEGNIFQGKVFIGEGCELENCTIIDAVIYPGTKLKDCYISNSVIDESCDLAGLDLNQKLVRHNTRLKAHEVIA